MSFYKQKKKQHWKAKSVAKVIFKLTNGRTLSYRGVNWYCGSLWDYVSRIGNIQSVYIVPKSYSGWTGGKFEYTKLDFVYSVRHLY